MRSTWLFLGRCRTPPTHEQEISAPTNAPRKLVHVHWRRCTAVPDSVYLDDWASEECGADKLGDPCLT